LIFWAFYILWSGYTVWPNNVAQQKGGYPLQAIEASDSEINTKNKYEQYITKVNK
jgi:hypothetical protein